MNERLYEVVIAEDGVIFRCMIICLRSYDSSFYFYAFDAGKFVAVVQ